MSPCQATQWTTRVCLSTSGCLFYLMTPAVCLPPSPMQSVTDLRDLFSVRNYTHALHGQSILRRRPLCARFYHRARCNQREMGSNPSKSQLGRKLWLWLVGEHSLPSYPSAKRASQLFVGDILSKNKTTGYQPHHRHPPLPKRQTTRINSWMAPSSIVRKVWFDWC